MMEGHGPEPGEGPVAWFDRLTIAVAKKGLKKYGSRTLANVAAMSLILKGMPAHALWPVLGIPLVLSFVCLLAPTLFYAAMLAGIWLDKMPGSPQPPQKH